MEIARRQFISWLAAAPASLAAAQAVAQGAAPMRGPLSESQLKDVLNVNDLEALARQAMPPAHFGYIATVLSIDLCKSPFGRSIGQRADRSLGSIDFAFWPSNFS